MRQTRSVALRIQLTVDSLGRSRFAVSPVHEVLGTLRLRERHPAPHARTWFLRAKDRMPARLRGVLEALVPVDHPYCPDFLSPAPTPGESVEDLVERIAGTPAEVVEHHLDVGLRGRMARDEVVAMFPSADDYERWRRPVPAALEDLLTHGPRAVAAVAAEAIGAFFDVAVREDWRDVRSVLDADIRRRSDLSAARGAVAMLESLGPGLSWHESGISLARDYEGIVDWAHDGLLLVPTSAHVGPVQIAAERPLTPMVFYRADAIARLWGRRASDPARAVADLIGDTRAALLVALTDPRSTSELSRELHWTEPTVSYHLRILLAGRLVDRDRRGRRVLYQRTALGSSLLCPRGHTRSAPTLTDTLHRAAPAGQRPPVPPPPGGGSERSQGT